MSFSLHNKWVRGKVSFQVPPLSEIVDSQEAVLPAPLTLDPAVGVETVLFMVDHTPLVHELRAVRPFRLMTRAGVVETTHGPVAFFLFRVPRPDDPDDYFWAADCTANPKDPGQMAMWRRLARQTHWHVCLVGSGNRKVGLFEFENVFDLDETLDFIEETSRPLVSEDFDLAVEEYKAAYSIDHLFTLA